MTLYKNVNGIDIPLTPDEEQEHRQREVDFENSKFDRLLKSYTEALVSFIEETASSKNYSSALSCASYKDSTNALWASEASIFIAWRDNAYLYAYDYLDQCQSGEILNPTIETFLAGIPPIVWPTNT